MYEYLAIYEHRDTDNEIKTLCDNVDRFGISLSEKDCQAIISENRILLKNHDRFEFGNNTAFKIAEKFAVSSYVSAKNIVEITSALTDVFYDIKNNGGEFIPDSDIIDSMFDYFENRAGGSVEYLHSVYFDSILHGESIDENDERMYGTDELD